MKKQPIDAIIEQVEKNLSYKAYVLSLTCPFSKEDLLEIGRFEAIQAYSSFIPDKGYKHYNWMVICGYQRMCKHIHVQKRKLHVHHILGADQTFPDAETINKELEGLHFEESLEDLGPSAREVIEIILRMPLEIAKVISEGKPKKIRGRLRALLRRYGWSERTINESFTEIKQFLRV